MEQPPLLVFGLETVQLVPAGVMSRLPSALRCPRLRIRCYRSSPSGYPTRSRPVNA